MCGIAGIYKINKALENKEAVMNNMIQSFAHRGPDDEGIYINGPITLGHKRLSILDLTETGHQPMISEDERYAIVFNGEIYNFRELKKQLKDEGLLFKSTSDTEVILKLYSKYGGKTPSLLNGIFSFAIWDNKEEILFLARDPFGVKPLYYYKSTTNFVFASEIKAILKFPEYEKGIDYNALNSFLTYRFNPAPLSLFKGIKKLEQGFFLTIQKNKITKTAYKKTYPQTNKISFNDALENYRELLENAVKRQIISDVPVGLLLSGGIDSAVIGTLMQNYSSKKIKTFTVGFEGKGDFNELADAKRTAQIIGSDHYEHIISKEEYFKNFTKSFYSVEEPIGHNSIPALYSLSYLASKHLKVVLSGQGADEPLAGYDRYYGENLIAKNQAILRFIPRKTYKLFKNNEKIKRGLYALQYKNELDRFIAVHSIFNEEEKNHLIKPEIKAQININIKEYVEYLYQNTQNLEDTLSKMLFIDTRFALSDNLLLFGDKITMLHSLESRVPFLDLELINFLESLPSEYKLKGKISKHIHKEAIKKWLPNEIINRKKRGFDTPFDQWISTNFINKLYDILLDKNAGCLNYFNKKSIEHILHTHKKGKGSYQRHLYLLFSFELWYQYFFNNNKINIF